MRELYKSNFDYYKNQTSAFKQNYNNSIKHFPEFSEIFIKVCHFRRIKAGDIRNRHRAVWGRGAPSSNLRVDYLETALM